MSMDRKSPPVKRRRSYVSPRRTQQALETRAAIVAAAERLFLRDGFAGTTITAIATAAAVSVDTIYKGFGGKPGLVRAICEKGLEGEGPVAAATRSDELQRRERDPRAIIRGWGLLLIEVAPRVSPILLLLRAAAGGDPEMDRLQAEMDARRLTRMTANAGTLADHLRPGLTVADAGEILWTYSSPDLYELLVLKRGWSLERYGSFAADAMIAALLDERRT